jgi:hypothetical protein
MSLFRSNLEKDFEYFIRHITKLEPVEFCGLAKILSVDMYKKIGLEEIDPKELKGLNEEQKQNIVAELIVPMEEILEQMMDKFLSLPRKRRKEINQILKDTQRGR